jgi:tRNA nucleotidyltransferase (CCA-adding enzyme)
MTSPVQCVEEDMVEDEVGEVMMRGGLRALPVVDKSSRLVGLVTFKEIAAAQQRRKNMGQRSKVGAVGAGAGVKAKAWMLSKVMVVRETDTLDDAEKILVECDIGSLPVLDGERRVVGMLTRTDLLRQHRFYDGLHCEFRWGGGGGGGEYGRGANPFALSCSRRSEPGLRRQHPGEEAHGRPQEEAQAVRPR